MEIDLPSAEAIISAITQIYGNYAYLEVAVKYVLSQLILELTIRSETPRLDVDPIVQRCKLHFDCKWQLAVGAVYTEIA